MKGKHTGIPVATIGAFIEIFRSSTQAHLLLPLAHS